MSTRHLIAAAALMATTFAAQADVIPVSSASPMTANMNIVDSASSLNGVSLSDLLAASNSNAELYLVRGVEGLYMVASRTIAQVAEASADVVTAPVSTSLADVVAEATPAANAGTVAADTPVLVGATPGVNAGPVVNADPVVNAAEVPEPTSIALLLAGALGAAGFMRARKQG